MTSKIPVKTLIVSHPNTDFDAFASMLAVQLLYPGSVVCLHSGVNRNVREFFNLHADQIESVEPSAVEPHSVETVILVEVSLNERLGAVQEIAQRKDIQLITFDHHPGTKERIGKSTVIGSDGSLVTTVLKLLSERGAELSVMHATAFALGIHEDTGSLTFPSTTDHDAEALAYCLRAGANQEMLGRYLRKPLTDEQMQLMLLLAENRQVLTIEGLTVVVTSASIEAYVEDVSGLANRVGEVADWDALFICVAMQGRTLAVGRSRSEELHADRVLHSVGGGGHKQAASAVVSSSDADAVLKELVKSVTKTVRVTGTAEQLMSTPIESVESKTSIADALVELQRLGHSATQVEHDGQLTGLVMREDLDRAVRHELGHAPVKAVMSAGVPLVGASTSFTELRSLIASGKADRVLVAQGGGFRRVASVPKSDLLGVVTRGDLLRAMHEIVHSERPMSNAEASQELISKIEMVPQLMAVLPQIQKVATTFEGVFLVGGAVRDVLIGETSLDLDLMVEGDAIDFARGLAKELGGRHHPHEKFHTAVVRGELDGGGELQLDIASARTEFYESPGAEPRVERSTLRQDLARRDFTINSMAASLKSDDFCSVYDFFGGYRDLKAGVIRVLHNLSFVEDPTRIFRALRYEARFGFKMEQGTFSLAVGCVEMRLAGDLSSARLRDELFELIAEDNIDVVLKRLEELGIDKSIHPKLACGRETVRLIESAHALLAASTWGREADRTLVRLSLVMREMLPDEVFMLLDSIKLKRSEQDVVVSCVAVAPRLIGPLSDSELSPSDLYKLLHGQPVEVLATAAAVAGDGTRAQNAVREWLDNLRYKSLEISGDELVKEGVPQSPALGRALEETLHLKLDGFIEGKEQELETALRLARREIEGSEKL